MSAERQIPVTLPNLHQECGTCPFAERAVKQTKSMHIIRGDLEAISIECKPSGGGGSSQVEPGKWVEFEGRTMTSRPTTTKADDEITGISHIPVCPHFPIENLADKYPQFPSFDWSKKDDFGRSIDITPRRS